MNELSWSDYVKKKQKEFGVPEPVRELKIITSRCRMPKPPIELPRDEKLFNIHKRSLPVGADKIVVLAVSERAAKHWLKKLTKSKEVVNQSENCQTKIYYDIVPVDAPPKERSVYFNLGEITI